MGHVMAGHWRDRARKDSKNCMWLMCSLYRNEYINLKMAGEPWEGAKED
jgi:hypothetical protein